uniref:Putative secreted peptide n=1 Tax=Anopheles braziliensis TaxID=58242 RepID=A0A2M3ZQQ4_9DIPT
MVVSVSEELFFWSFLILALFSEIPSGLSLSNHTYANGVRCLLRPVPPTVHQFPVFRRLRALILTRQMKQTLDQRERKSKLHGLR